MLKYWNETLENISKDQRNEKFKMIVNNKIYEIPLSFAIGISPLISDKYFKDPSFHELNIPIITAKHMMFYNQNNYNNFKMRKN